MDQPSKNLRVNPFCRVQLQEPLTCDLLLDETSLELPSVQYLPLLARLSEKTSYETAVGTAAELLRVSPGQGRQVVDDLVEHRVLVDGDTPFPREDKVGTWLKRGWTEGLVFHLGTRNLSYEDAEAWTRGELPAAPPLEELPSLWKTYPGAPSVDLPPAAPPAERKPLETTLRERRCNRAYRTKKLTLAQLSTLLHHGSVGILKPRLEAERTYRTQPEKFLSLSSWSAVETYFVAFDVEGLEPGLYHYDLRAHRVEQVKANVERDVLVKICLGQRSAGDGAITFLFTGVWERFMSRYHHSRAHRNLFVNVAELGQRYLLMGTALGLSTFMTPQTLYRHTQKLLGVPHFEEGLLYVVGMG